VYTEDYEHFLTVEWVDNHLLIVVGDSMLYLSRGFLIACLLLFAVAMMAVAVRLWNRSDRAPQHET
jgi:hypothetical protein